MRILSSIGLRMVQAALSLALLAGTALADDAPFARKLAIQVTVRDGNALDIVETLDTTIMAQAALQSLSQVIYPVNEHFQTLEVLEAATVKPDGRRIDVAHDKILISATPNASTMVSFQADVKVFTVIFPDVAVGDTVHLKTRLRDKGQGSKPGFSLLKVFPASGRFAQVVISLDPPEGSKVAKTISGFAETSETVKGRLVTKWTLQPQPYRPEVGGETSPLDREPMVLVSNYPSDTVIGDNFFKTAQKPSLPTADIKALAETITKDVTNRREQAAAIYDYVSKTIRYVNIVLGSSGFVPHNASAILAAKYGDCKDHATLMRSLLLAKGIDADFVLINAGPAFKDISTPSPQKYTHAILYLPEFDLYVDPTQSHASFGVIGTLSDKPVLRVGDKGVTTARTPPTSVPGRRIEVKSDVTLRPDGTPAGSERVTGYGTAAIILREVMAAASLKGGAESAKQFLEQQRWEGSGALQLRDPTDHVEPYVVNASFDLANRFFGNGPNKNGLPFGPTLFLPDYARWASYMTHKEIVDITCQSGGFEQTLDLHLPAGKTLAKLPEDRKVASPPATFTATYVMQGQTLHVERRFEADIKAGFCTRQMIEDMRPAIQAAAKDAGTHIQFAGEPAADDADTAQ